MTPPSPPRNTNQREIFSNTKLREGETIEGSRDHAESNPTDIQVLNQSSFK